MNSLHVGRVGTQQLLKCFNAFNVVRRGERVPLIKPHTKTKIGEEKAMKTVRTLNKLDVRDRVGNVADRIQTICLLLENVQYLDDVSDSVSVYSEHPNVAEDLISLCVSELLSAADKLNTLAEDCREYESEKTSEVYETE